MTLGRRSIPLIVTLLSALAIVACGGGSAGSRPAGNGGAGSGDPGGGGAGGGGSGTGDPGGGSGSGDPGGGSTVPARFFLPTGGEARNSSSPSIELDSAGNAHMVYPARGVGDAFYAFCAGGDCGSIDQVKSLKLPTSDVVTNAMLAVGSDGRPHVLLTTMLGVHYAGCSGDCTQPSSWTVSEILAHQGDREVSGEAFAVTPDGKLRFVMHTYRAFMGVGQKPPATFYVTCDGDCSVPSSWTPYMIANQIWQESKLTFTAAGHPRLATVATVVDANGKQDIGGYVECDAACTTEAGWSAIGLAYAYSNAWVEQIEPAISMSLTAAGGPRIALLEKDAAGLRNLSHFACDADCMNPDAWHGGALVQSGALGSGLDIALDAQGRSRIAYTAGESILLAHCSSCTARDAAWDLVPVERSADLPVDEVIPYWNCTAASWFLKQPTIAIGADGVARVAYVALDVSGGTGTTDPTKPRCGAGPDMMFARYARVPL